MANFVYPKNLANEDLNPAFIQFQFYERTRIDKSQWDDTIQLYMPEQAAAPSTVSWDTEKFGFIGAALASAGKDRSNFVSAENLTALSGQGAKLLGAKMLAMGAASAAQVLGGSVSADGLLGEVTGKIPNPYLTMVFRGVDFRSFAFQFKFAPFSETDCDVIDGIIKTFRANSLPPGRGGSQGPAFLGYPKEVQIGYYWRGEQNKWLNKFKRAVCTAVDVDYTPAGMFSTMRNGFPAEIVVSLKFSEIELVLRDDVANVQTLAGGKGNLVKAANSTTNDGF